jgi:hypothetical protein
MKKFLLAVMLAGASLVSSCSDDDEPARSTMTATIGGEQYRFNTFVTTKETFPEGYTDVTISATIDGDPYRMISFVVEQGVVGGDASYYFAYFENETAYAKVPGSFSFQVDQSTENHVKGTFSGDVRDEDSGETISITNGAFNIRH